MERGILKIGEKLKQLTNVRINKYITLVLESHKELFEMCTNMYYTHTHVIIKRKTVVQPEH